MQVVFLLLLLLLSAVLKEHLIFPHIWFNFLLQFAIPCLLTYLFIYCLVIYLLLILCLSIGCTVWQLGEMGRWCVGVLWSVLILFPCCKVLNDDQSLPPSLGDNVDHEVGIDLWRGLQVVFSHFTSLTYLPAEKNTDLEGIELPKSHNLY